MCWGSDVSSTLELPEEALLNFVGIRSAGQILPGDLSRKVSVESRPGSWRQGLVGAF